MKALITGIAGFAGRHLTRYLLEQGHEVAGLEQGDEEDWKEFAEAHKVKIFKGDLRDEDVTSKAIKRFKPDTIFHLAAQSSVKNSFENPFETFSVNVIGTLVLFETISKVEMPIQVLVITSSEIYGPLTPEECPVKEDHPLKPVNPYAVSKASVDLLAYQYFKAYQLQVYIARAFSHSGPGQKTVGVLSDWAFQLAKIDLELTPPEIKIGNINVKRDYTDVRDVVRAYADIVEKGKPAEPYNVCSGVGYQLADMLDKLKKLTDKEIKITVDQSRMRPVDIPILIGSNEKLVKDTGWKPVIPIETTLNDTFQFWHEHLTEEMK